MTISKFNGNGNGKNKFKKHCFEIAIDIDISFFVIGINYSSQTIKQ